MEPDSAAWPTVSKPPGSWRLRPNIEHYNETYASFRWQDAERELDGLPGGRGLNIAHEAVDRHARGRHRERTAVRWLGASGRREDISYGELAAETNRCANMLAALGIPAGEPVFLLAERIPELVIAALGALKRRNIVCVLERHLSPETLRARTAAVRPWALLTTASLYSRVVAPIRDRLGSLQRVIVVGEGPVRDGTLSYGALMAEASTEFSIPPTSPEDPAAILFTSGTTGTPRGVVHVHRAVAVHHATGTFALDLHDGDIVWCTADTNWAPGACYGVISALSHGLTTVIDEAELTAERAYEIIERERTTVWYTTPTAIHTLREAGARLPREHNLSSLRFACSVGERLHPRAVLWGLDTFGLPIHDNWMQTETGGIVIANLAAEPIRPGSMGRPVPGATVAVVRRTQDGLEVLDAPAAEGELAIQPGLPSLMRTYTGDGALYRGRFAGGWYLTGDFVRRDRNGYYWSLGRSGETIPFGERLLGACEIESVLASHPQVSEAGVIAQAQPGGETWAKAFVHLEPGTSPSGELERALLGFARRQLGRGVVRNIEFTGALPRTRNGQILHRVLRARELGEDAGDLSTLAEEPC